MLRLRRVPGFPLNRFVRCLWYQEGARRRRERALPTGTIDLIVRLSPDPVRVYSEPDDRDGQALSGAVLSGVHTRYFVLGQSPRVASVGAHFRPGGAGPVLGVPAAELTDRHLALADLWGAEARWLEQRVAAAGSPARMLIELERLLTARLNRGFAESPLIGSALIRFETAAGNLPVAEVIAASGLGSTRFIRDFRAAVGLTPKRYCRILRLQSVIDRLAGSRERDWARLAADHGYYDQSHLIREFGALAGLTPARYRPIDAASPNHVAV